MTQEGGVSLYKRERFELEALVLKTGNHDKRIKNWSRTGWLGV